MEETIRWAVDALDSPMDRSLIADRLKEALQAAPSREPDAVSVNLADAREFCEGAFGPFGVDIEPYVKIIAELMARAALRSVPDGAAGGPITRLRSELDQARGMVERLNDLANFIKSGYARVDVNHERFRVEVYAAALDATAAVTSTNEPTAKPSLAFASPERRDG